MVMHQNEERIIFKRGNSDFSFLPSGDVFEFTSKGCLINQFQGCATEGSANNIYLRIYHEQEIKAYPLLGLASGSSLSKGERTLVFTGCAEDVSYKVSFFAADEGLWLWDVDLTAHGRTVDVVYGQDIGVASKGGVLTNELYMAQYLGHSVFESENGYIVCSRQNQPQDGCFPYLQQGMIRGKAIGYATDGTQFFGLSFKATDTPAALVGDLPNQNYQYEFSYTALQSEKIFLQGQCSFTFYGVFKDNQPEAIREASYHEDVANALQEYVALQEETSPCKQLRLSQSFGDGYVSTPWSLAQIQAAFPARKLEEVEDGQILSFFTDNHTHVVLQQKELLVERPHGHIIMTNMNPDGISEALIASTNYIYGLFNAQTVIGNTSYHKFLSPARGLLNVLKSHGQRIYIKLDEAYRILTLPAAYEMGMNFSRWYYELPGDTLVITAFAAKDQADIVLQVKSLSERAYDFIITNQLVLGENEFQSPVDVMEEKTGDNEKILRFRPVPSEWVNCPYTGLHYDMQLPGTDFTWSDDRIFFDDGVSRNGTLLTFSVAESKEFQMIIQGRLENAPPQILPGYCFEQEFSEYRAFYAAFMRDFHLEAGGEHAEQAERLNETAWWYCHDAMIHFSSPHGLEQPGGAAWGTRDVCQGPWEYFMATQHYMLNRKVLLTVFSHQQLETGEWPQWFMFDKYTIHAGECHGDVVFWPLKCVSEYLSATGDYSVLAEQIPYVSSTGSCVPENRESLLQHIKRCVETIQKRFVANTFLLSYAGGDWDDTLQPADEAMKDNLVSSWTVALAYQALHRLGQGLESVDKDYAGSLAKMADSIRNDFISYCIKDGVTAGFLRKNDNSAFDLMLHPTDKTTGIRYRLLPMTRSIIAEMVDKTQAEQNLRLIDEHFLCPDGVRLMDRPARYDGGVSHLFQRAEQAANVGREISLQYVHAHIRYVEAMAKLGEGTRAWDGLLCINPILIKQSVPNAVTRQSNVYFSSSDGLYMDRYDYQNNFDKLRDGSIAVRGGWRLYSSGPGIYMNQLIANVLGLRFYEAGVEVDPALPVSMEGLRFSFTCFGQKTTFVYRFDKSETGCVKVYRGGQRLPSTPLTNIYRQGGVWINKDDFLQAKDIDTVEIIQALS